MAATAVVETTATSLEENRQLSVIADYVEIDYQLWEGNDEAGEIRSIR